MTLSRLAVGLAWILTAALIFVTWCPQGLRPHFAGANVERFAAFFVTASAFVIGFPRRSRLIVAGVLIVAVTLEMGQLLIPGRDAGVIDCAVKALGGVAGVVAGNIALRAWREGSRAIGRRRLRAT